MTPKGRRRGQDDTSKKTTGTPDTAAESPCQNEEETRMERTDPKQQHHQRDISSRCTSQQLSIPELFQLLDTQLRVNMGAAVRCGICLSTFSEPISRTPCGHAFCRDCILACIHSSSSPKCPECNTLITKRSLQPGNDFLVQLAKQYKTTLQDFGWTPSTYQANFTTLTQKPLCENDSMDDDDEDENETHDEDLVDRLNVAATWQQQALPHLPNITPLQHKENQAVVDANIEACESLGYVIHTKDSANSHLPNTQDILDTAREQQVADYELEANREEDDESLLNDDQITNTPIQKPKQKDLQDENWNPTSNRHPTEPNSLPGSHERRRVSFLVDHHIRKAEIRKKVNDDDTTTKSYDDSILIGQASQESLHLSLSPIFRKQSILSPSPKATPKEDETLAETIAASDQRASTAGTSPKDPVSPTITADPKPSKTDVVENLITINQEEHPETQESIDVFFDASGCVTDNAATRGIEGGIPACTTEVDSSKTGNDTVGLVEDSFGAMHWVNHRRGSTDVPSPGCSVDEDNYLSLSLTATYDDPSMDYKRKRAAIEEAEEIKDRPATTVGDGLHTKDVESSKNSSTYDDPSMDYKRKRAAIEEAEEIKDRPAMTIGDGLHTKDVESSKDSSNDKDTEDHEEDSQETKIMRGASNMEEYRVDPNDDSDATIQMSSVEMPDEEGIDDDSTHSQGDTTSNDEEAKSKEPIQNLEERGVPAGSSRRRAQSEPSLVSPNNDPALAVGDVVNVQSRTWSGINKPGGVARITKLNGDGSYNVAYVLGGREANVDAGFISRSDGTGNGKRRKTIDAALPAALLRSLKAQGFDTTGEMTLEQAKEAAANRDHSRSKTPKSSNLGPSEPFGNPETEAAKKCESSHQTKMSRKRKRPDGMADVVDAKRGRKNDSNTTRPNTTYGSRGKECSTVEPTLSPKKDLVPEGGTSRLVKSDKRVDLDHEQSNEEACVLADARYKSRLEDAISRKVLHVVTSGLSSRENENLISLSSRAFNDNGTYIYGLGTIIVPLRANLTSSVYHTQ